MRGVTHVTAILSLAIITVLLAGTAYVLLSNTFGAYADNIGPQLSFPTTPPESCGLDINIDDVCFAEGLMRVSLINLQDSGLTTNSQIAVEGNLFIAIIPFTPPQLELNEDVIVVEIDYKPSVIGDVQRVYLNPKIQTEQGEKSCDAVVYIVEEERQC